MNCLRVAPELGLRCSAWHDVNEFTKNWPIRNGGGGGFLACLAKKRKPWEWEWLADLGQARRAILKRAWGQGRGGGNIVAAIMSSPPRLADWADWAG